MMATMDPDSHCALTARPMTPMTLLNQMLLVNFVSILGFAFECNRNMQIDIKFAGRLSTRFGV
jgi:hypothetical protein